MLFKILFLILITFTLKNCSAIGLNVSINSVQENMANSYSPFEKVDTKIELDDSTDVSEDTSKEEENIFKNSIYDGQKNENAGKTIKDKNISVFYYLGLKYFKKYKNKNISQNIELKNIRKVDECGVEINANEKNLDNVLKVNESTEKEKKVLRDIELLENQTWFTDKSDKIYSIGYLIKKGKYFKNSGIKLLETMRKILFIIKWLNENEIYHGNLNLKNIYIVNDQLRIGGFTNQSELKFLKKHSEGLIRKIFINEHKRKLTSDIKATKKIFQYLIIKSDDVRIIQYKDDFLKIFVQKSVSFDKMLAHDIFHLCYPHFIDFSIIKSSVTHYQDGYFFIFTNKSIVFEEIKIKKISNDISDTANFNIYINNEKQKICLMSNEKLRRINYMIEMFNTYNMSEE